MLARSARNELRMRKRKKCKYCEEPSIPGLSIDPGLCQYHWNERIWGKNWADEVKRREDKDRKEARGTQRD